MEKVLILEGNAEQRSSLLKFFQAKGCDALVTASEKAAKELLKEGAFDLFFCDLDLLRANGDQELFKFVKITLAMTAFPSLEGAVEAIHNGAFNYLKKPLSSFFLDELFPKLLRQLKTIRENHLLRKEISRQSGDKIYQIIAESLAMKQVLADVSKIAKSHANVLISGETGTGKEVIAQAIHLQSERSFSPFIKVNCAAIPEGLIEAEFFGHEKGAFTGALELRLGRFELAHRGTLLLDEITEIPLHIQVKLLRAIQELEFERVGSSRPIKIDVRIVATTNRDIKEAIQHKQFREDLYYRLNVVPIRLFPLRERQEDILPLAEYFLDRFCVENHRPRKRLSPKARKKLLDYHWPGNIRELANLIERTVVMDCCDLIEPEHLNLDCVTSCRLPGFDLSLPIGRSLKEVEKQLILETLSSQRHNRTKAAKILGISVRTLRNKLLNYKCFVLDDGR